MSLKNSRIGRGAKIERYLMGLAGGRLTWAEPRKGWPLRQESDQ